MATGAVNIDIKTDEDLRKYSIKVADDLRKMCDDFALVEAQLNGRLRAMQSLDGKSSARKARNVVMHIKTTRLYIWAGRKAVLGVYKSFLKQFGPEIAAIKNPTKKPAEALKVTS
jgi:hypothetical protein